MRLRSKKIEIDGVAHRTLVSALHVEKNCCSTLSGKRFPPSPYRCAPGGSLPCRESHMFFFATLRNTLAYRQATPTVDLNSVNRSIAYA